MPYTVRNVRSFKGHEGPGFSATLYLDGRKVADVLDDGNGGCYRFYWLAKDRAEAAADERALAAHVATLPNWHPAASMAGAQDPAAGYSMDADTFVGRLVDEAENAKRFRRLLSSSVVMVVGGELHTAKAKPTPATLEAAAKRWPDARILNTLPADEAVALMLQVAA